MHHPDPPENVRTRRPGLELCHQLRTQITDGALVSGARLPSTRALAADLGVSRTTVTAVYEQLAAEGYLVTAPGRVARVAEMAVRSGTGRPAATAEAGQAAHPAPSERTATAQPWSPPAAASAAMDNLSESIPRHVGTLPDMNTNTDSDTDTGPDTDASTGTALWLSAYGRRLALQPATTSAKAVRIDFLYGAVASRDFPLRSWRRALQAARARTQADQSPLGYIEPEGDPALRRALQAYLARARGLVFDAEQVLVVHGSQQGIDLAARLLLDPGDAVVMEDPGYLSARRCFEAVGARRLSVRVDEQGLVTPELPDDPQTRLAYVTPSHQFPLGGVLPIGRRHELLQWAERRSAWILEDDYDGEFRYGQRPIDALQAIDRHHRVIYVGTFSKALSPQLRLGYMVLPPALVPVFRQAKRLADRHAPVAEQRALANLIDSGAYERHVRRTRREHERRRTALLEAVARHLPPQAHLAGTAAGLHAVLWLPGWRTTDEATIVTAARASGVGVYPLSGLYAPPCLTSCSSVEPRQAGLILGYASLTPGQVTRGLQILGQVLAALPRQ